MRPIRGAAVRPTPGAGGVAQNLQFEASVKFALKGMIIKESFRLSGGRLFTGAALKKSRTGSFQAGSKRATAVESKRSAQRKWRNKGAFTEEEDKKLAEAVRATSKLKCQRPNPWRKIAALVGTRDAQQCMYRWTRHHSGNGCTEKSAC